MRLSEFLREDEGDGTAGAPATETPPAPAPVPAPETPPADVTPPAVVSPEEDVPQLDLTDILDESDDETPPDGVQPPPAPSELKPDVTPPVAPEPAPSVEPAPQPPTDSTVPPVTPPVQPAEVAPAPVQPPAAPQPSFEELRGNEITRLEAQYKLSDEDARAAALEPETVLPKLAARLHVDMFESVVRTVTQALPGMMESISQQRTAHAEARDAFYSEFEALKDPKYTEQVTAALTAFQQVNPAATREQAIANVGVQVSLTNRVPLPQKYLAQMGTVTPPVLPGVPPAPITPAVPGGGGGPPPNTPENYYTRIAEEPFDE